MHYSRLIILFSSLAGVASSFLPWKSESMLGETTSTAGVDSAILLSSMQTGDGWITIVLFVMILLLVLTGKRTTAAGSVKATVILLLAAGATAVTFYSASQMKKLSVDVPGSNLSMQVAAGYGLYITLFLSLVIILATLAGLRKRASDRGK